jgi:hypothetical protein
MFILVLVFHHVFAKYSYRQGMAFGTLLTSLTTLGDLLWVLKVYDYIGVNQYVFLIITNLFEDFVGLKYGILANSVINARITPHSVEATIFAVLTGMNNLGFGVLGPLLGNFWAEVLGINLKNFDNFYMAMIVKLISSFIPLIFLPLIPNKEEIDKDEDLKSLNKLPSEDENTPKEALLDEKL